MPLGKRTDCRNAKFAGIIPSRGEATSTIEAVQETLQVGFDFVALPLNHEKLDDQSDDFPSILGPDVGQLLKRGKRDGATRTCIRSDLDLTSSSWNMQVVGTLSDPFDEDQAMESAQVEAGLEAIGKQIEWATYLGLQAVVFPPVSSIPSEEVCVRVAQSINERLQSGKNFFQIWVQVPLVDDEAGSCGGDGLSALAKWHTIRSLCDSHTQIRLCLVLGQDLPCPEERGVAGAAAGRLADRWLGEPVKAVVVPMSAFKTNSRGYPTLPKRHQEFLTALFKHGVQVLLKDDVTAHCLGSRVMEVRAQDGEDADGPVADVNHPYRLHWEYLSYLFRRMDGLSEEESVEFEYRDYLQAPLQPLQDHLESATYEVFERDATKYVTYERAVHKALVDKFGNLSTSNTGTGVSTSSGSGSENGGRVPVVMVVGAGRGPLVQASLRASASSGVKIRVFAVEKNPSAYITLLDLHRREGWGDDVTLVHQDMRTWGGGPGGQHKADILVSELLGSFGDNELSPECLDGAQAFLAEGGVSIPQSYTSYLAPITSSKLHEEIKSMKGRKHMETPYVVRLFSYTLLADNKEAFTFKHPNFDQPIDNNRFRHISFERFPAQLQPQSPSVAGGEDICVLHGFAGYFESVLYGDVLLSIRPETHTPNMFSWFPIFFPLPRPVMLGKLDGPGDAKIDLYMWRKCSNHKVWYEYALTRPEMLPIINPGGRSYAAEL